MEAPTRGRQQRTSVSDGVSCTRQTPTPTKLIPFVFTKSNIFSPAETSTLEKKKEKLIDLGIKQIWDDLKESGVDCPDCKMAETMEIETPLPRKTGN